MKKFIALILALTLCMTSSVVFADYIYHDFSDFTAAEGTYYNLPTPKDSSLYSFNFNNKASGTDATDGITAIQTDRGTSMQFVNQVSGWTMRYVAKSGKEITGGIEVKAAFNSQDLKASKIVALRGPKSSTARNALVINKTSGSLSLFGNSVGASAINTWYDLYFRYNLDTGYYYASIKGGAIDTVVEGKWTDGISLLNGDNAAVAQVYFGYSGVANSSSKDVPSWVIWDDIAVNQCSFAQKDATYVSDFASFEGSEAPEALTAANAVLSADDGGVKLTASADNASLGFDYTTFSLAGKYAFTADIKAAEGASYKLGDDSIFKFAADGNIMSDSAVIGTYTPGSKYSIMIKADTIAQKADISISSADGDTVGGTLSLSKSYIDSAGIYLDSTGDEAVVYSMNVYNNAGLGLVDTTPSRGVSGVLPCDINAEFTAPIVAIDAITTDGGECTYTADGNKITIHSADVLPFDTACTVSLTGVTDALGNKGDFDIKFTTKPQYKLSDVTIKENAGYAKASVTGIAYDGGSHNYQLIATEYDKDTNKLLNLQLVDVSLSDTEETYTNSIAYTEGNYYEAYLWDSIDGMNIAKTKAVLGTEPLTAGISEGDAGFKENMDTGLVEVSGQDIDTAPQTHIVLYPGKTPGDIDASNPMDAIAFIKQFDSEADDVYAFGMGLTNGEYGTIVNKDGTPVFTDKAFNYLSLEYIANVYASINGGEIDLPDVLTGADGYNEILQVDLADFNKIKDSASDVDKLEAMIISERSGLAEGKFAKVSEFQDAYSISMAKLLISKGDVEYAYSTYGAILKVSDYETYPTFDKLSDKSKSAVYTKMSKSSVLDDMAKVEKLFNECTVLEAIRSAENQVNIKNILNDNNGFLEFDLSDYNSLTNKSKVNSGLVGKEFAAIDELERKFKSLVADAKDDEGSKGSGGNKGGGTGGGGPVVSLPPKADVPAPDTNKPAADNTPAHSFKDMADYAWADKYVAMLSDKGIISGKSADIFAPSDNILREEAAKIIVLAFAGLQSDAECEFTDIPADAWFYSYVASAKKLGFVNGISDIAFGQGSNITREDLAVMIYRAAKAAGYELNAGTAVFNDSADIADYAVDAVGSLNAMGIISGTGGGSFNPKATATRAEAAKIIGSLLEKGGNK